MSEPSEPSEPAKELTELTCINLGCGRNILKSTNKHRWINVDRHELPGVDVVFDLDSCATQKLPFDDDSVDYIFLSHVIEHLHNVLPLMQELHRVAKNEACMQIKTPHGASDDAWEDPTHLRAYFPNSFAYFSQPYYWRADYGYRGDWKIQNVNLFVSNAVAKTIDDDVLIEKIHRERNWVNEIDARLTCVKPIREPKKELQTQTKITAIRMGDAQRDGTNE